MYLRKNKSEKYYSFNLEMELCPFNLEKRNLKVFVQIYSTLVLLITHLSKKIPHHHPQPKKKKKTHLQFQKSHNCRSSNSTTIGLKKNSLQEVLNFRSCNIEFVTNA